MRYQRQVDNLIALLVARGITDQRVLAAIAAIPREFLLMKRSLIRLMRIMRYRLVVGKQFHSLTLLRK